MSIAAGTMTHRVRFERRGTIDDGYGNVESSWFTVLTVWAAFRPKSGRESVEAGRLESTVTGTLTVRPQLAMNVTAQDRVVFLNREFSGRPMNIRSVVPMLDRIEMVLEDGVAT